MTEVSLICTKTTELKKKLENTREGWFVCDQVGKLDNMIYHNKAQMLVSVSVI